jgi:hypothetical protein
MRTGLIGLFALGRMFFVPVDSGAQSLSGRVIDQATGAPVPAGFVRLIDASGTRVSEWLTNDAGLYRVTAPAPGRYRVRVERLGYQTFESEPFALDSTVVRDFRLPSAAIALPEITARSTTKCEKHDVMTPETALLWGEVRKALDLTSWTADNAAIKFDLVDQLRYLDSRLNARGAGKKTYTSGVKHGSPFAALAKDSLIEKGFIQATTKGHYSYFAPDAALIMSEPFQETHCFLEKTEKKRPDLIGLGFEPAGMIKPYDVRGTLWIERVSGLLTSLEYTYDKLPVSAASNQAGGEVQFTRFDSGMWIVSGWSLRVPIMSTVRTSSGIRSLVGNIQEKSQYVVKASIGGRVVYTDPTR